MIIASHQPDLLPHTGFWYKMAHADAFDVAVHDQFQLEGYQRRVKMRGHWAQIMLQKKQTYGRITGLRVLEGGPEKLWDTVRGRYAGSPHWEERHREVQSWIERAGERRSLTGFNCYLIEAVKHFLGIPTPLFFPMPQESAGALRVAERIALYQGDWDGQLTYLSGRGAEAYMKDELHLFAGRGIEVLWSNHQHTTGDSILTAIFDDADPLATVMKEFP